MSQKLDQLSHSAMDLPPNERAELAERIWDSITAEEQADIEQAWRIEVDRRIEEAERRGAPGIPAEEVLNEIEADLRLGRK